MTTTSLSLAPVLMAAAADGAAAAAPEWIHLLPAGTAHTADARGPYRVADAGRVIALSFEGADKLPIDENHATDLAAPLGQPSPARGWIVAMEAREDGIWGRVEWTEEGAALVASRAYRAISPVVTHDAGKAIGRILRASLVNRPNLRGLTALHMESAVTFLEQMIKIMGLDPDATEEQVLAACRAMMGRMAGGPALQAALAEIGTALGVEGAPDAAAVLAAAKVVGKAPAATVALQAQVAALQGQVKAQADAQARAASEAYVDQALADKRAGVNAGNREELVALHMSHRGTAEKLIMGMPKLGTPDADTAPPVAADGTVALHAAQREAARLIGVDPKAYADTLKSEMEAR